MTTQYTADDVARMLSEINKKIECQAETVREMNRRLDNRESRMESVEHVMERLDNRMTSVYASMGQLETRMNLAEKAINAMAAHTASMIDATANQHEILKQRLPAPPGNARAVPAP